MPFCSPLFIAQSLVMGYVCTKEKCARERSLLDSAGYMACMSGQTPPDSGSYAIVEQEGAEAKIPEKKPKIKENNTATYKQFDEEVSKLVCRVKRTTEENLEKLAA